MCVTSCSAFKAALPTFGVEVDPRQRIDLETVVLGGRRIVVEVNRPLMRDYAHDKMENSNQYNRYYFWDYCQGVGPVWKFVQLDRPTESETWWRYIETTIEIDEVDFSRGEAQSNEGRVKNQSLYSYEDIKGAGLAFFKPGPARCGPR